MTEPAPTVVALRICHALADGAKRPGQLYARCRVRKSTLEPLLHVMHHLGMVRMERERAGKMIRTFWSLVQ